MDRMRHPENIRSEDARPATSREQPGRGTWDEPVDDAAQEARGLLISENDAAQLRQEWLQVQGAFVDDPRQAVQRADDLVQHVVRFVSDAFDGQRARLEEQWSRGDEVSTEDLRIAIQRYRDFFQRLLEMRVE